MKVNFVDLKAQYLSIKDEVDKAIEGVLSKTQFSAGPSVEEFEEKFAKAHKAKYCIAVNSGTSALHIALLALDIGHGDEVIVPANTFFATPEAVSLTGAVPVFVDCEERFYNIDPEKVEKAINKKTRAITAVHLYGQPAQIDRLRAIARKHKIFLIEDCAQAHLSEYKGKPVGTYGVAGCFSFYPSKNLGAFGEGGAVITNNKSFAKKILALRDHGSYKKYYHDLIGHNYRMEGLQGAVLNVKMKYISKWTKTRIDNAAVYREHLDDISQIILPELSPHGRHVYHLFVIRTKKREKLKSFLESKGIYTGIHYPIPCHLQKAYAGLKYKRGSFPNSEKFSREILSLPMSEQLKKDEIIYTSKMIGEFFKTSR
ncbi:DegT/DnrJ/EryC1/StrS family aminotransferase [Spirochaetota bacterium]